MREALLTALPSAHLLHPAHPATRPANWDACKQRSERFLINKQLVGEVSQCQLVACVIWSFLNIVNAELMYIVQRYQENSTSKAVPANWGWREEMCTHYI